MKKQQIKNRVTNAKNRSWSPRTWTIQRIVIEKVLEEGRQPLPDEMEVETLNTTDWGDRGEDLANMRDPFVQEPERDTQIPPELTQTRPGNTPRPNENLADRFDAEREK